MERPIATPAPAPDRPPPVGLVTAATITGAFGVASLPLFLAYPDQFVVYLLGLAGPLAVALAGEALRRRWLRWLGLGVLVAGATAPIMGFGLVLVVIAILGPLGVVTVVGTAIREIDPTAGTAFLSACAIAIVGGFAGAVLSPPIVLGVTVLVLAGGTAVTVARLGDHRSAARTGV